MKYEEMLNEGKKNLPEITEESKRFEIPKVEGHVEGNKTIITNFLQIADIFRRDPQHIIKYLQRELATPAYLDNRRLVLGRKIGSSVVNQRIEAYAKEFVLCKECGKPDTQIIKEERVAVLKCTACGAKHSIKIKI